MTGTSILANTRISLVVAAVVTALLCARRLWILYDKGYGIWMAEGWGHIASGGKGSEVEVLDAVLVALCGHFFLSSISEA
jgi:hypothetical protein